MATDERAASPLPPGQRTLPAMLQRQAVLFGERPLLRIAGRSWSHRDAAQAAGLALRHWPRRACSAATGWP